jgi:uncharacterized protein YjcR
METKIITEFGNANINPYGYYKISSYKEGNHGRLLHTVIWEKWYNKRVPKNYDIHHIDENKLNNEIWNLQCIESRIHRSHHMKKRNPMWNKESLEKMRETKKRMYKQGILKSHNKLNLNGEELYNLNQSGIFQKDLAKKFSCHVSTIERKIQEYKKENNIIDNKIVRNDLPSDDIFKKLYFNGMTYEQIAEKFNCSISTVWRRISK